MWEHQQMPHHISKFSSILLTIHLKVLVLIKKILPPSTTYLWAFSSLSLGSEGSLACTRDLCQQVSWCRSKLTNCAGEGYPLARELMFSYTKEASSGQESSIGYRGRWCHHFAVPDLGRPQTLYLEQVNTTMPSSNKNFQVMPKDKNIVQHMCTFLCRSFYWSSV